ncbi:MAG: hypothetical protein K2J77_10865 [Oscillospiraceae bacterium]|nr:hypothetical protein [Oscillospiraceae bacterium]
MAGTGLVVILTVRTFHLAIMMRRVRTDQLVPHANALNRNAAPLKPLHDALVIS